MSDWKGININSNLVEKETERAVLFKMPKNSEYKGWQFWHPKKCVHEGKHSAALNLGYTADWDFKLTKQWKDGTHKEEKKISVDEFENAFDVINTNIEESAEAHAAKVAKGIEKTTAKLERKLNKMSNVEYFPPIAGDGDCYITCPGDDGDATTMWWHYALRDDGTWYAACGEKTISMI